jgi:CDP-6-deoxy-D-xylo-4-hexulose-3-dehydrase
MQAAIGVAQLKKLEGFLRIRKQNHEHLLDGLKTLQRHLILPRPADNSEPAWFGFPITVSADAPFTRNELLKYLDSRRIATRLLFGGNLIKQPAYRQAKYRVAGELASTDRVMNSTFWIGNYPGLTKDMLDYVIAQIMTFIRNTSAR